MTFDREPGKAVRRSVHALEALNGGRFYVAEVAVTVDGRQLVARATGDTAIVAEGRATEQLRIKIPPAGDDDRMLMPGEWVEWARQARRGWRWRRQTLVRELQFRDFEDGLSFIADLGRRAQDHTRRPDISIAHGRVTMQIANPHRAGITLAELRLAAKVNAVIEELGQ